MSWRRTISRTCQIIKEGSRITFDDKQTPHWIADDESGRRIFLFQDDWQKGRNRQKGTALRFYISTTQDIDQLAADAKKMGIRLDAEPHDTEWGTRAFEVTEPSGFKLTIASPW